MITCRAPGKLFIAGEYAVVEPGRRAVLTAVDRYATATVRATTGSETTLRSDLDGGVTLTCHRRGDRIVPATNDFGVPAAFSYVFAAVEIIDRLLGERGLAARPYRLELGTDLGDADGRKFGLGASAAVTAATVAAVGQFHALDLDEMARYRLAMLATIAVNRRASGGDVAAATWGGWIAYSSPDRDRAAATAAEHGIDAALRTPWPGLSVRALPEPAGLALRVGWTGTPASTPHLVAGLSKNRAPADRARFHTGSDACVERLTTAFDSGDTAAISDEIHCARELLIELDEAEGLGIMTPRLRALCAAAAAVGAAAKPSGAGGGDCGIAFVEHTDTAALAELGDRWLAAGIRPLPLRTPVHEGSCR
ncbi:phosphomevalonate kinase [Nocardia sp. NPDC048505]|uniref:phosphomevalonate kinase n=1 Tax=unclassified Nocardia TaxID=2637762 RepID=UPI00340F0784